ncbi:MAG: polyketide cyclase / dehydrase and lipid transport [Streptosporangiales bacterium]|nr:polyketide cyclase / dehydrase and lipid transport [Streptosporangiales bacterium]
MPLVDLVDETFVVAPPQRLADAFADPRSWRRWWPSLALELAEDRGVKGLRWRVVGGSPGAAHPLRGTSEVWLEASRDGTIVHFYLRADPVAESPGSPARVRRLADQLRREHAVAFKARLNALKDELEDGRAPGEPGPSLVLAAPARLSRAARLR